MVIIVIFLRQGKDQLEWIVDIYANCNKCNDSRYNEHKDRVFKNFENWITEIYYFRFAENLKTCKQLYQNIIFIPRYKEQL